MPATADIVIKLVLAVVIVGAGVIFKGGDGTSKVSGIITAAMIWVTAGLGMAIGAGYLGVAASIGILARF